MSGREVEGMFRRDAGVGSVFAGEHPAAGDIPSGVPEIGGDRAFADVLIGDDVFAENSDRSPVVRDLWRNAPVFAVGDDGAVGWVVGEELLLTVGCEARKRAAGGYRQAGGV